MKKTSYKTLIILILFIISPSCYRQFDSYIKEAEDTPANSESLLIHNIQPSLTDSSITTPDTSHYSGVNISKTSKNLLVVFLGGTAGDPSGTNKLLNETITLGYHALSINYPNANSVGSLAQNDLTEYGKIRCEIAEGIDASLLVDISPSDSILNRTAKLIIYLAQHYPDEGWEQFLTGSQIIWSKVIISGFSQGAGHAAYIAQKYPVFRTVIFSGIVDGRISPPYQSADWITIPENSWATPFSKFRFFVNTNDGFYPAISANMITLGYDPSDADKSCNVDINSAPFGAKNALITSLVSGTSAHASTCSDAATPLNPDGSPVYKTVWQTLF